MAWANPTNYNKRTVPNSVHDGFRDEVVEIATSTRIGKHRGWRGLRAIPFPPERTLIRNKKLSNVHALGDVRVHGILLGVIIEDDKPLGQMVA